VLAIVPLLPWLMREIWRTQRPLPAEAPLPPIERPWFAALALGVLLLMVTLFLVGESLPFKIVPPEVSIIAATLALLAVAGAKVEPVEDIVRDVDWKTLVFLFAIFCMVEGFTGTGLLQGLSLKLDGWFGTGFLAVALVLLAGIGALSSLLANIPVVAVSLVMVKGYLVVTETVPESALAVGFTDWPAATLPVFVAMMFGATLGGNATLIGASANVVAGGICTRHGCRVNFARFFRLGLPVTLCQLALSALYVLVFARFAR
jgi:Na+/H+ antiporter NhaD/arsenite permease-like protein